MNLFTYLLHLPAYIGLPILVVVSFIGVVAIVSIPLAIIYWLDDGKYPDAAKPVDNSTDGGAGACAICCVACI